MEIIKGFIGLSFAYLLGSISNAIWIGKLFYHTDIRNFGSKNAGATNTIRVLGLWAGILVLGLDIFKAWLAVFLGGKILQLANPELQTLYLVLLGIFVVMGHIFPVYTSFKGGKGVASIVGVLIALYCNIFPFLILIFILVFLISRYISLASICSAVLFPAIYLVYCLLTQSPIIYSLLAFSILVALFIPLTHKKNIKRLLSKEEPKFKFKKTV